MSFTINNIRNVNTKIRNIEVGFKDTSRICILNTHEIKSGLINIIKTPGTHLILNLEGINFIDSQAFDDLNEISTVAKESNSLVALSNVSSSVMELIDLVKKYSAFEINTINTLPKRAKVA